MSLGEPELITIIEGPTPEFQPTPQRWLQSIHEGPTDRAVALCQLRTGNGADIMDRCQLAWQEKRPVRLDFPDEIRMRQQVDVVAMRLEDLEEGEMLTLWVSLPFEVFAEEEFDEDDLEFDEDDFDFDDFEDDFDDYDDDDFDFDEDDGLDRI